jgi:hypothetical protein
MPGFTWWGGLIGSKLLTHVVCNQCQTGYCGKTGASNTGKIAAYMIITGVIVVAIFLSLRQ